MGNMLKTFMLLGILSVLLITLGRFFGGQTGMIMAFGFALLMNGGMYFFSDKLALSMNGAKPITRSQYPELYEMVEELTKKMKLPMPKLYITPTPQANAFATGRDPHHASVAVTEGIMHLLSKEELKAVLAHEMGHVKNRDILIASIAAVIASAISFISNMAMFSGFGGSQDEDAPNPIIGILAAILVPIAASIIQMAVSRQREYGADETGAKVMGSGEELAKALLAIEGSTKRMPMTNINPAFSSLYIENPLGNVGPGLMRLFSTHPPTEDRIKRLRKM